jgi:outer membrane protein TolC
MKIILSFTLLLGSLNASAVFEDIWKGYQVSKIHQSQRIDLKINEANYNFNSNMHDWNFSFTPNHTESNLASIFSFQSQKTITDSMAFGLNKSSFKFGTFSLSYQKTTYDISKWSAASLKSFADSTLYENRAVVEYEYDFLDDSKSIDYDIVKVERDSGDLEAKINIEKGYLDFFTTYLQAKYQVYAVELTKSFIKEASKRVKITKRRLSDGTSRKVEYLQAKSSLLNQNETLEKNRSALKQNLAIIENIIEKRIDDSFFSKIKWDLKEFSYWDSFITKNDPMSLDLIMAKIAYSEKQLEKIHNQSGYKLAFNAGYTTNALSDSDSTSMNEAMKGNSTNKSISLNFVIPLGMDKKAGLRQKYTYQKKKNELDLLNAEDEVKVKKEAILEQIRYLEKSNKFAKQKVDIATQTLKEQSRLYQRGQASFEEVIRSEEAFINAKMNEKRMLLEYELLIANYAYLNNSMMTLLSAYQD